MSQDLGTVSTVMDMAGPWPLVMGNLDLDGEGLGQGDGSADKGACHQA